MTGLFKPAIPSYVRFRNRHVHKTISAFVEEKLTELGWVTPPINFSSTAVHFQEIVPDDNSKPIAPNTVAITLGSPANDELYQLGGGLWHYEVVLFVDVYGTNQSIAQSIGDDVRDQIGRDLIIPLYDWTDVQNPARTDNTLEFESVEGPDRPPISYTSSDFRKFWRTVKATVHVYYYAAE